MTADLLALGGWLEEQGATHVAMESTGVYWKPLFNLLEERFTLVLANAQHIKQVPGRKTDVKDCEWIGDLLRHGLLRPSYVPDRPQRELRELTRYRTTLVRERAREVNRLQKTLEGANVKLGDVASDVLGTSSRAILAALMVRLYLEGLSSGDFEPIFRALVGETAALSASSIVRLKEEWQQEYETWKKRPLVPDSARHRPGRHFLPDTRDVPPGLLCYSGGWQWSGRSS
jgi:transposase